MLALFSLHLSDALETDLERHKDTIKRVENVRQVFKGLYNSIDSNSKKRVEENRGTYKETDEDREENVNETKSG